MSLLLTICEAIERAPSLTAQEADKIIATVLRRLDREDNPENPAAPPLINPELQCALIERAIASAM